MVGWEVFLVAYTWHIQYWFSDNPDDNVDDSEETFSNIRLLYGSLLSFQSAITFPAFSDNGDRKTSPISVLSWCPVLHLSLVSKPCIIALVERTLYGILKTFNRVKHRRWHPSFFWALRADLRSPDRNVMVQIGGMRCTICVLTPEKDFETILILRPKWGHSEGQKATFR